MSDQDPGDEDDRNRCDRWRGDRAIEDAWLHDNAPAWLRLRLRWLEMNRWR